MKSYLRQLILAVIALAAMLATPLSEAQAQEGFELQQFNPMPNVQGNFLGASSADVAPHLQGSGMVLFNYGNQPLVLRDGDGDKVDELVGHHGAAHMLFSLGVRDRFEVGLDIPVVLFQDGNDLPGSGTDLGGAGAGLGDIRLVPKAQLWSSRADKEDDGVALAVLVDGRLPTGSSEALRGDDFRLGPQMAFDGVVNGVRGGVNVGYTYRSAQEFENLDVRDTLDWKVAAEVSVIDELNITGELSGKLTPAADSLRSEESPMEMLMGAKFAMGDVDVVAGGGLGLTRGYGTPRFRSFLGMGWRPGWGQDDEVTPAPQPEPECTEETVAADCPDASATVCEDGILITDVAICVDGECAYEEERQECADGYECGETNGEAACVEAPECRADTDCTEVPEPVCEDGVLQTFEALCVDEACEYPMATEKECGEDYECGRSDGQAACVERTDRVEVDEETQRIEISEMIQFETGSDRITSESQSIIDEIAQVMENHPEVELVRIEGHTDNVGERQMNMDLSKDRANAVRTALVERGIDQERMEVAGFGPDEPIADNATPEGRAENRRVEFHIEE